LLQTKGLGSLTPAERMRLRKEQKAREEFEKMKQAAQQVGTTKMMAKQN
jgi:hypothetical protein